MIARIRSAPRGMWPCVLVAVAASWLWSVATPWFQVPDEIVHIGYVHYVGETGRIPRPLNTAIGRLLPSTELNTAITGVPFSYQGVPLWDREASDATHARTRPDLPRKNELEAGSAANNPPLYYYLVAVPYRVTHSANLFDRILAMRWFSSLFAGLTAMFTFLFLRELLPGAPWAWTVGTLGVALHPLLGFISGGVNPDGLLWAECAALFWLIARAFRRGLTIRRGVGIGACVAAGLVTKAAMFGMLPGVALALVACVWLARGAARRVAWRAAAAAIAVGLLPFAGWEALRHVVYTGGHAIGGGVRTHVHLRLGDALSYIWQLYLPKMPWMSGQFPKFPLWDIFFKGFVGKFGYADFGFQDRIYHLALVVVLVLLGLAARGLWLARAELRPRLPELAVYVVLTVGVMFSIGVAGYSFSRNVGLQFEQARYLLLLLPLYGAILALAARGAGRVGRYVGLAIVGIAAAHQLFSVLLTAAHYYS